MRDAPPEWYDPIEAAYWRMTRKIEQEFLTGVGDMATKKRVRAAKRIVTYVAVVVRKGFANYPYESKYASGRDDGGWFALMGEDKDKLIQETLESARTFGGSQAYEVAVGVLDEMVVTPTVFQVVKL